MNRFDRMEVAEALYDLGRVRAARPCRAGECSRCHRVARARFPVLVRCLNRVTVDIACARCAMLPRRAESRWYIDYPTRAEAERDLAGIVANGAR